MSTALLGPTVEEHESQLLTGPGVHTVNFTAPIKVRGLYCFEAKLQARAQENILVCACKGGARAMD